MGTRENRLTSTVNQLFIAAIYFRVFVFMDTFAPIYFRRLQNWAMQEECTICLFRHFRDNLFLRISLSRENKSLAKIN